MRALLVDLGNVLVRFDHGITLRSLERETGASPEHLRRSIYGDLTQALDTGRLDMAGFFRAAEARASLPLLPDEVWIAAWRDIFEPIPEALAALAGLAPDVRTALVSNTNDLHWKAIREICDVESLVDTAVLSFEVGAAKPDPAIYQAALRRLGAAPSEAVFADDRPEFVEGARAIGIDGFVVDGPSALARELGKRGFLSTAPGAFDSASDPLFALGLAEFEQSRFFEAHEEWETLWKRRSGDEKLFLQGLIQLAAGCVKLQRGAASAGRQLLGKALDKLERFPSVTGAVRVSRLCRQIRAAMRRLDAGEPVDPAALFTLR